MVRTTDVMVNSDIGQAQTTCKSMLFIKHSVIDDDSVSCDKKGVVYGSIF